MCRMLVFAGTCTRCEGQFTWDDLTQELWCLEAKNEDIFGQCSRGVQVERHAFDQECDRCEDEDEGLGMDDDFGLVVGGDGQVIEANNSGSSGGSSSKRERDGDDGRKRKKQRT